MYAAVWLPTFVWGTLFLWSASFCKDHVLFIQCAFSRTISSVFLYTLALLRMPISLFLCQETPKFLLHFSQLNISFASLCWLSMKHQSLTVDVLGSLGDCFSLVYCHALNFWAKVFRGQRACGIDPTCFSSARKPHCAYESIFNAICWREKCLVWETILAVANMFGFSHKNCFLRFWKKSMQIKSCFKWIFL